MSTLQGARTLARVERHCAQLEGDLRLKREQVERYYRRNCLLESLVRAQATLLQAIRVQDRARIGAALEEILALRHELQAPDE